MEATESTYVLEGHHPMETSYLKMLQGDSGRRRLVQALQSQPLVHDEDVALEIAKHVKLEEVRSGVALIREGASDTDLFLILAGEFSIVVNQRVVARKRAGEHVGEMALLDPDARRSASAIAVSDSVVARISESEFTALADKFPRLWRRIAMELASRLRNESETPAPAHKNGRSA
jgi:CRP/FNR family transcriptional regulator, cyclic AMP receptor protein